MELLPGDQAKLEVLLRESSEIHESIGRTVATTHTLFGAVLPLAGGVLLFTVSSGSQSLPLDFIASAFGTVICLAIIYNAGLWVEVSRYFRYKYLVIQPRMYQLVGENHRQSFGEFLAQDHIEKPLWHTPLFHALVALFSLAVTIGGIVREWTGRTPLLLTVVAVLVGAAVVASVGAFRRIKVNMRDVAFQRLKVSEEAPNPPIERTKPAASGPPRRSSA
jgi:hypothetical protein